MRYDGHGKMALAMPNMAVSRLSPAMEPVLLSASEGWYKTYMYTPEIDISDCQAGTFQLVFDSSWRPEFDDNYHQSGILTASFNGQEELQLFLWLSDTSSPYYKDDSMTSRNEMVTVNLDNPPRATSVVLKFGMFDAGNDWWWAIDNIKVVGMPKLIINNLEIRLLLKVSKKPWDF